MMRGLGLLAASACLALVVSGCAKNGPSPEASGPARLGTPPPASSPMAKVHEGMRPEDVVKILGTPTHQKSYPAGKAWIPWYFGPDRWRSAYFYKGMGRVIFKGEGGFSTDSSVLRVEYDPSEPG